MINPDISARISLENSLTEYIRIMTEIFKVIGPGSIATRTGILFPMNIPLTPRPIAPPIVPPRPIAPPGILSPEYMHRIARPVAPVVAPIGASIRFPIDVTIEHFRKIKPDIVAPVSVVVRPPIVLSPEYMHKIAGPMPVTIRTIVRKSPSLRSSGSPPV
jgi:hypothetical protein